MTLPTLTLITIFYTQSRETGFFVVKRHAQCFYSNLFLNYFFSLPLCSPKSVPAWHKFQFLTRQPSHNRVAFQTIITKPISSFCDKLFGETSVVAYKIKLDTLTRTFILKKCLFVDQRTFLGRYFHLYNIFIILTLECYFFNPEFFFFCTSISPFWYGTLLVNYTFYGCLWI